METYDYSIYYSQFHDDSETHVREMEEWHRNLLSPHVPDDKQTPVLDIGCGFGFALRALRCMGFKSLEGVEASPQQAAKTAAAGFNVSVSTDTIAFLEERKLKYGFIILKDVLEHVPVAIQIDFLRAIFGSLKPGGRLFLTVPNANSMLASRWRYGDYTHFSSFTEHSLHFVLRNAGFEEPWLDSSKGIGRCPRRIWKRSNWPAIRKWMVRWCWLQVFQAELSWLNLDKISFELNLVATAEKSNKSISSR